MESGVKTSWRNAALIFGLTTSLVIPRGNQIPTTQRCLPTSPVALYGNYVLAPWCLPPMPSLWTKLLCTRRCQVTFFKPFSLLACRQAYLHRTLKADPASVLLSTSPYTVVAQFTSVTMVQRKHIVGQAEHGLGTFGHMRCQHRLPILHADRFDTLVKALLTANDYEHLHDDHIY